MINFLNPKIKEFLSRGDERTILTKKNVTASFLIKGMTIIISLILIPLTINYVNAERMGVWLTLYSMVIWLGLFDIGLGNGMKNKLTEAKAMGNNELAQKYVSTTYVIFSLIALFISILFLIINPLIDWIKVFKVPISYHHEISILIKIIVLSFCFTFVLNLLKPIVTADQRPAVGAFLDMISQVFTLLGIFILSKTVFPSLISLGLITMGIPILIYIIASFILFNTKYKKWKPCLRCVDFKLIKNIMTLGIKFFIATIAAFLITQTLPFLIQRISNPIEVTNYNTSLRLFIVAYNIVGIIIFPYWSSFTDAYAKGDFLWMKKNIKNLHKIFRYFIIVQLIILILSPAIYYIWVNFWIKDANNMLNIPFIMSATVCLHFCSLCWLNMSIFPLNGIGKIKLQVYSSLFEMILFIPLSLILGKFWGVIGVILAPTIIYIPRMIWAPIQLKKLVNNTSSGIWNK